MAKNSNRDEFSAPTKRLLEKQSGNHCSNPSCRRVTSAASSDGQTVMSIGEASHITAAAPGGPRYDATLTSEERKSPENGIWLCKDHAKETADKRRCLAQHNRECPVPAWAAASHRRRTAFASEPSCGSRPTCLSAGKRKVRKLGPTHT